MPPASRAPPNLVQAILAAQAKGGGFPWSKGGIPDSNDTAAAIEALRAAGVGGAPVRRALVALRTFQNRDGGFALTKGRESDAQSTAWAIQALISAGQKPGKPPFRYLSRLRRADGSYRYSVRYGTTPVWVTAQVRAGARRQAVSAALIGPRRAAARGSVAYRRRSAMSEHRSECVIEGAARPEWGRLPVAAVVIVGFLLAAIVGMTSAASPWVAG